MFDDERVCGFDQGGSLRALLGYIIIIIIFTSKTSLEYNDIRYNDILFITIYISRSTGIILI